MLLVQGHGGSRQHCSCSLVNAIIFSMSTRCSQWAVRHVQTTESGMFEDLNARFKRQEALRFIGCLTCFCTAQ
jgi:hypothetical protein